MAKEQHEQPYPLRSDQDDRSDYFRPNPKECILLLLHKFMGNKSLPQCSSIFDDRNPYDPDQLPDIFLSAERRQHGVYLFTKLSKKGKLMKSSKNASRVVGEMGSWHCDQTADIPYNGTRIGTVRTLSYREKEKGSGRNHRRFQIHEYTLPENTQLCYNPLKHYVFCHLSLNDHWCNGKKVPKAKKYSNNYNRNNSSTSSTTHDHDQVPKPTTSAPAAIEYDQVPTMSTSAPAIDYDQVPMLSTSAPAIDYDQVPTMSTSAPALIGYDQVPTLPTSAPAAIDYDQVPTPSTSAPIIDYDQAPTLSTSAPALIGYDQVPTLSTSASPPAPAAIGYDQVPTLSPEPIATFQDGQAALSNNTIKLDDSLAFSSGQMMLPDDSLAFLDDIVSVGDDFGISQAMLQEVDSYIQDITDDDFFSLRDSLMTSSCI